MSIEVDENETTKYNFIKPFIFIQVRLALLVYREP